MNKVAALLLTFLAAAPLAHSQRAAGPAFTSAYTDMKRQCRTLPETAGEEGGDPSARCTGYGGYRLAMHYSATSATVVVQRVADGADVLTLGTDYGSYGARGEKVEWRTAGGKPFAVIMRVWKYAESKDGNPYSGARVGSTLVVRGLPGWEKISAEVDGSLPDANARARGVADGGWIKR